MSNPEKVKLPLASSLQQVIGALLFGADHPLTVEEIRTCLKSVAEQEGAESETAALFAEASPREINDAIESIAKELSRLELGVEVAEINSGFRFQTQPSCGRWVQPAEADSNTLSRPALETLAIIAYRQPVAKSEIEAIRGVSVDHIVKALMELHLIRIVGRSDLPGRPFLYGTTASFLNHFGLGSLKELNELDPTLQRSKPSERKAVHTKKKKPDKDTVAETPLFASSDKATADAAPEQTDAVKEILGGGEPTDAEPVFEGEEGEEA